MTKKEIERQIDQHIFWIERIWDRAANEDRDFTYREEDIVDFYYKKVDKLEKLRES